MLYNFYWWEESHTVGQFQSRQLEGRKIVIKTLHFWCLTADRIPAPTLLHPFVSRLWASQQENGLAPSLGSGGKFKLCKPSHCSPWPYLQTHCKPKLLAPSFAQAILECLECMLSPEILIMWIIKLFIPSWCMCIISLNSWATFAWGWGSSSKLSAVVLMLRGLLWTCSQQMCGWKRLEAVHPLFSPASHGNALGRDGGGEKVSPLLAAFGFSFYFWTALGLLFISRGLQSCPQYPVCLFSAIWLLFPKPKSVHT